MWGRAFCLLTQALLIVPGRTQTLKEELKEKFTTFSKAQGLTEEDIVFLPQPGEGG